jgi:hypothetical protein
MLNYVEDVEEVKETVVYFGIIIYFLVKWKKIKENTVTRN